MSQSRPGDRWGNGSEDRGTTRGPTASIEVRMQPAVLPTLAVLLSEADDLLEGQLRFAAVRAQAAVVRTLVDDVERLTLAREGAPLRELLEGIARLTRTVFACAVLPSQDRPWHRGAPP